jgi:hypothetical protein
MFRKKKPPMIQIHPFKKRRNKEVKEDPNSMANGRFHCLVALERFHYLVANGRRRKSTFSPLLISPPTNFT